MNMMKKATAVLMITAVLFSTGCATLPRPVDKYKEYTREEAAEENLRKYNDPEYLKKVLSNTAIPQGYYDRWEPFDIKKEKVPDNYGGVIIGTVLLAGMIAGGIWGYTQAEQNGSKMGVLAYMISVPYGVVLGALPGAALTLISAVGNAVSGGK